MSTGSPITGSPITGADVIAARLAEARCRFAFGIPGGEVLALIDALDRAGIATITARHENAAGFMAEGTWHATGAPGVLVATVGPGVANAANVVANAHQDRVPLIVLTGAIDEAETFSYTHQVFDHRALLAPITKASLRAATGAVDAAITRAIAIATTAPHGPVHLDVPIGVATAIERAPSSVAVAPAALGVPAGDELAWLRDRLAGAERPLVIAGLGALAPGVPDALAAAVQAIGAPLITTYKAKGALDERDPLALGGAGLSPRADSILLPLVRGADVVLLAGYDPIEMRRNWRDPFAPGAVVIDLVPAPPTHGVHHATRTLVCDLGPTLDALSALPRTPRWAGGEPARARAALREAFAPEPSGWGPFAIAHAARRVLPDDAIVTVDTGAHRIALAQAFECRAPRAFLQSSGLCTMGCALPLAIGRALAEPARPVVAFVGDGGLDMTLGELATARDLEVPVVIVVLDDRALELIALKQRAEARPSRMVESGATDYAAVARALGGEGVTAKSTRELEQALGAALARRRGFTLVHCPIPRGAYDGRI